jgi:hypothetical protein
MKKTKFILYGQDDILTKTKLIKHNNAFIMPDGNFYLAKGYTGCNPSHQLESSALAIARKDIAYDIIAEYNAYCDKNDVSLSKRFYYFRSVLVHYYGYVLFARIELIKAFNDRNRYFDYSLIPDPKFYGKEATLMQIKTLEKLFEINDDGTLQFNYRKPTSQDIFQKVLIHKNIIDNWHR